MSFVTTPITSSSARARHSAATSAVLPLPTGPPMPMRGTRVCSPAPPWSWSLSLSLSWPLSWPLLWRGGLGRKETHLLGRVDVGEQLDERRRIAREFAGLADVGGNGVDVGREFGEHGVDAERIEPEESDRGRGGTG